MMMHRPDPTAAIRSLRSAAPYIRMYKGKTFVVKAGGGVFADAAAVRGLIEQIAILHYFGVRVVFVHGGFRDDQRAELERRIAGALPPPPDTR